MYLYTKPHLPLDPKTMKNEGFETPNLWVITPKKWSLWVPMVHCFGMRSANRMSFFPKTVTERNRHRKHLDSSVASNWCSALDVHDAGDVWRRAGHRRGKTPAGGWFQPTEWWKSVHLGFGLRQGEGEGDFILKSVFSIMSNRWW